MGGRPEGWRPRPVWATLAVLVAACTAFSVSQSLLIPALPLIQEHLDTSQTSVSWVFTAFLLSASIFTPILGRLGDLYGKRRMLVFASCAMAGAAVVAALTTSIAIMIAARAVQGVAGGVMPLCFGLARDELPADKVPGAIGTLSGLAAAATGIGLVLCGPVVDLLGYQWLFWSTVLLAGGTALAAFLVLPPGSPAGAGRIRWQAPLLLSAWLVALLLGVSKAPEWGWGSARTLGLIALAAVLIPVWCRVELRSDTPLVDMHMMRRTGVWTSNLIALLFGAGLYATLVFLPAFLQAPASTGYGFGASVTESGLILLPFTIMSFLGGLANRRVEQLLGSRGVIAAGCVVGIVGFLLFVVAHDTKAEVLAAMTILGSSFGLLFSALAKAVVAAVPARQTGVATGMNANIRTLGGAFGAAISATILAASATGGGAPTEAAYEVTFLVMAGAMAVATLACVLMPRAGTAEPDAPPPPYPELALSPAPEARPAG